MVSRRQFLIGAHSALVSAGAMRAYAGAPETSLFPATAFGGPDSEVRAADRRYHRVR
jgi:hypothetical protein